MQSSNVIILFLGIFLEALSIAFRSLSLGFRLFANVAAGHVLSDIAAVGKFGVFSGFISVIVNFTHQFLILAYESAVSVVQIGVFLALLSVYAG